MSNVIRGLTMFPGVVPPFNPKPEEPQPAFDWRSASDAEMVAPIVGNDGKPVPGHVPVPKGDLKAYGERYREAIGNTIDRGVERRQAQRKAGIDPDAPPVAAAPAAPQGPLPEPGPYDADPQYQKDMAAIAQIADPVEKAQRMQVANGQALDRKVLKETGFGSAQEQQRQMIPTDVKRRQWLETMARRYAPQIANGSVKMADLIREYDSAAANAPERANKGGQKFIDRHAAGVNAARNLTDLWDVDRAAQKQLNVNRAHEQNGIAQNLGVSRGVVMAMQDVQKYLAEGKTAEAAAKMAMYGVSPEQMKHMWGAIAAQQERMAEIQGRRGGKDDQPPPDVVGLADKGLKDALALPPGNRLAALDTFHTQRMGPDANPADKRQNILNSMQGVVQKYAARGVDNLSQEERIELQQVIGDMSYSEYVKYAGTGDTPQARAEFKKLTGNSTGFGDTVGTFARGVVDWMVPDVLWDGAKGLMGG